jgi:alkaline phosphatase D
LLSAVKGIARLAGVALDKLHYGVFTCSNYGWGYFNAYGHAATLDLDFWMHVGDYIYGAR